MFAVYENQINFQIPDLPSGSVPVQVITGCGTASEVLSNSETLTIQATAPEFFSFRPSTNGRNPVAAIDGVSGALLGSSEVGSGFAAAKPGSVVSIFGTSFGATDPRCAPAEFPAGIAQVSSAVKVAFGGRELPAANILYTGMTPGTQGCIR